MSGLNKHQPFILRCTHINVETMEQFSMHETRHHGWKSKEDFINSLSKHKERAGHEFSNNGYQYLRKELGVITKVEAI